MAKGKATAPAFEPYVCSDPASAIGGRYGRVFVLAPSFGAVRAVQSAALPASQLGVRDRIILEPQLKAYTRLDPVDFPLHSLLDELKGDMLLHGASPEAVMLVGAVAPFSEKDLKIMADKLTKKTTAPAKGAAAKKTTATDSSNNAPQRGGRSTLDDKAKITATDKGRAKIDKVGKTDKLSLMVAAKTVGKALEVDGVVSRDIHYAINAGLIEVA